MCARFVSKFWEKSAAFLDSLFPASCPLCEKPDAKEGLCAECGRELPRVQPPFCQVCSQPFSGAFSDTFTCFNCEERHFRFDCAVTPYLSLDNVREIIHQFKYSHHQRLRHLLSRWLAEAMDDARLKTRPFDAIVPVPLHPARLRERGFNQAGVLAELLSKKTGIPVAQHLRRIRYTSAQALLERTERLVNLRNAFQVPPGQLASVKNRHFLLIDDVFTTGTTVDECAATLKKAGARSVCVATVARGGGR
jgi:ComF family protein